MSRTLAIILLTVVAAMSVPLRAFGCSCKVEPVAAHIAGASAVFIGTAEAVGDGSRSTFNVQQVYKGAVGGSIEISMNGDCAVPFTKGSRYAVFAQGPSNALTTSLCAGTTEDYATLERAAKPIRTYSAAERPGIVAIRHHVTPSLAGSSARSRGIPIAVASALAFACAGALLIHRRRGA
ncbi:MAG: hypothetical protein NVSMB57_17290 [Actinomycetota bacterium]